MNGLLNVKAACLTKEMPNDAQSLGDDSEYQNAAVPVNYTEKNQSFEI